MSNITTAVPSAPDANASIPTTVVDDDSYFLLSITAQLLASLFAWSAILITIHHIYMHFRCWTMPSEQRFIVRILCIIPIFSFHSWLSLILVKDDIYVYCDSVRDWYEAFVIYNFLSLCYEYLGGEGNIMSELRGKPIRIPWYFKNKSYTIEFLRLCKQATLQFCLVKPIMSIIVLILMAKGTYKDGDWSFGSSYFIITIIYNVSVSLALYALYLFYQATKGLLYPYDPMWKFLTVKSIIFLSFWQGCLLVILQKLGYLQPLSPLLSQGATAAAYQSFFISIELFFAAIAFRYAFPFEIYFYNSGRNASVTMQSISNSLKDTVNPRDIMTDAIHNFHPQYQQYTQYNPHSDEQNNRSKLDSVDETDEINDTHDKDTFDGDRREQKMVELSPPPSASRHALRTSSPVANLIGLNDDSPDTKRFNQSANVSRQMENSRTEDSYDLLDEIDLMSPTRTIPSHPQGPSSSSRSSAQDKGVMDFDDKLGFD